MQAEPLKYSSHYSGGLTPSWLVSSSETSAAELIRLVPEDKRTVLVFTGFSGIAWAVALATELHRRGKPVGMMYVRKQGETSHGTPVHTEELDLSNCYFVFVDDFICSGQTALRMNLTVKKQGGISLCCLRDRVAPYTEYMYNHVLTDEETKYYGSLLGDSNAE